MLGESQADELVWAAGCGVLGCSQLGRVLCSMRYDAAAGTRRASGVWHALAAVPVAAVTSARKLAGYY